MLGMIWGERSGRGSRRRGAAARRGHRPAIEGLESRIVLSAAADTWTGGAGDGLWSSAGNWNSGVPAAGEDLVFPAGKAATITNDITGPVTYNSIAIGDSGYALKGNTIDLNAGITASYTTAGTSTYQMDTVLLGGTTLISVATSDTLDLTSVLSGASGVSASGGGTLDLSNVNTYTGTTTVGASTTLQVDGTIGGVQLQGGILAGNGTIGTLTSVGGKVSPGLAPATGTLTAAPSATAPGVSVTFDSGSTFATVLNSSGGTPVASELALVPPTGTATESVNLGGASLAPTLAPGYSPSPGDRLTILGNGSGAPVNGTFATLAEGAAVSAGNSLFRISYAGGASGRDVVLTAVASTSMTTLTPITPTTFTYGQSIPLMATVAGTSGTPTGTVEFFDGSPVGGGKEIASAPVNGGVAATSITNLGVQGSPHQIYALYIPLSSAFTYAGSTSAPQTITVNPATLTVTGVTAQNKQYDATTKAAVDTTGATLNGVINGDQVTLQTNNVTAAFATANAGANIPVSVSGLSLAGTGSTNYVLQQPTGLTANITPAPLRLIANDQTMNAGGPLPMLTYTAVGLQGTDTEASLTIQPTLATTATSSSPAGTYPIFISGGSSPNYTITDQNGTLTVVTSYATTTTLSTSNQLATAGQPVTFTATVAPVSPGAGTPTGAVAFIADNNTLLGLSPLNSATDQATITTASLGFGVHSIVAEFLANPPFQDSLSASLPQYVTSAGTTTTLTLVPLPNRHGIVHRFELVAQAVPTAPGAGTPTGTVTFFINARASYRTVFLTNGTAVLHVPTSRLANKYVYVRYNGTQSYIASASRNAYISYRSLARLSHSGPGGSLRLAARRDHAAIDHRGR